MVISSLDLYLSLEKLRLYEGYIPLNAKVLELNQT